MAIKKNEEFLTHVLLQAPKAEPYYPQYQNHDSNGVGCLVGCSRIFLFIYSSPCEEPSSYTDLLLLLLLLFHCLKQEPTDLLLLLLLFHCLKQEPGSLGATLPNAYAPEKFNRGAAAIPRWSSKQRKLWSLWSTLSELPCCVIESGLHNRSAPQEEVKQ